jgi:hypothetical protein
MSKNLNVFLLLAILPFFGFSQSDIVSDSLPSDEVEVLKRFNAVLASSDKAPHSPGQIEIDSVPRDYTYEVEIFDTETPAVDHELRFKKLKQGSFYEPYEQLIKVGLGYPTNPYGLISYGRSRQNKHFWHASLEHHSMRFDDKYLDFSRSNFHLDGQSKITEDWSISGGIGFNHRLNQYFPLSNDTLYQESDVQRTWSMIAPYVGLSGYIGDWRVAGSLDYHFVKDSEGPKQSVLAPTVQLERSWRDLNFFSVIVNAEINDLELDTFENSFNLLNIGAQYTYSGKEISYRIGASAAGGDGIDILPNLNLTWNLIDQKMSWSNSLTGNKRAPYLSHILNYNPYINPSQDIQPFKTEWRAQSQLTGRLSNLMYSLGVAYIKFKDDYFFQNDSIESHLFNLVFDDGNVLEVKGHLEMNISKSTRANIEAAKLFYSLDNLTEAWHKPSYKINIFIEHLMLQRKLKLGGRLLLAGDAAYYSDNTSNVLDPIVQVNFTAGYQLSQRWSLFLEANNLFNNKSTLLSLYESVGINFLAGILYKY